MNEKNINNVNQTQNNVGYSINNLSQIEFKNISINTSLKSFSKGEDILQEFNNNTNQPSVSIQ